MSGPVPKISQVADSRLPIIHLECPNIAVQHCIVPEVSISADASVGDVPVNEAEFN